MKLFLLVFANVTSVSNPDTIPERVEACLSTMFKETAFISCLNGFL